VNGSVERVRAVLDGRLPDRPPLYDLLRNDAVIEHFAGRRIPAADPRATVFAAYEPAIDATRPVVRLPERERTETLPNGREQRIFRWTAWTAHVAYRDTDEYAARRRAEIASFDPAPSPESVRAWVDRAATHRRDLGDVFFFASSPSLGLSGLYDECGLEFFAYAMADHPGLIEELLECNALRAERFVEALPDDHGVEAVFLGDDIAFKSGPLLSPVWFGAEFLPRLARICAAWHRRGVKVLFHSDGNLMPVLDGLVEAGIDGLNPIEVLAGMDAGEIHRRHPHLFLAGAIDVSQLLPFGSPEAVRDTVRRTIEASGGRLLVGSSTELQNEVPLANFLAMREATLACRY
jgi:hypothetical protein